MASPAAGIYLDGGTVHQADIIIGSDGRFVLLVQCIDSEQPAAAEDQLSLAEEDRLQVFFPFLGIRRRSAVRERIVAIYGDERTFLVLVVDGRAIRVGDACAVQDDGLFLGPIDLEETVGGGAGKFIDKYLAAGVVHRDFVAVHGYISITVASDSRVARLRESNGDLSLEGGGGDVIV